MAWSDAARKAAAESRKLHARHNPYGGTRQEAAKVLRTMKSNTKGAHTSYGFRQGSSRQGYLQGYAQEN